MKLAAGLISGTAQRNFVAEKVVRLLNETPASVDFANTSFPPASGLPSASFWSCWQPSPGTPGGQPMGRLRRVKKV